jgi:hypothetical protein
VGSFMGFFMGFTRNTLNILNIPSGKLLHNYGKSQRLLMGKSSINGHLNSYVSLPEDNQG